MAASSQGEQGRDRQAPARPVLPRTPDEHHSPAVTIKICLRCDWQDETKEPRCPNCGVQPLYVVGASPSRETAMPVRSRPEERSREAASTASMSPPPMTNRSPFPTDAVESSSRSTRSTVTFVLAALLLTVTLGTWLTAEEEPSAPAASTDAAVSPSPSATPRPRRSMTVEGVPFSYSAPTSGWEEFETKGKNNGSISINKSTVGPQGAEAIIYWTGFPEGDYADPCAPLGLPARLSAADLAAAVATAPGTELVTGPSDVSVGGRSAKHVVLTVREDVGCDPGYFYTWNDIFGGALWPKTSVGDTIRVWIVDVDGTLLFIAGETTDAGFGLEQEIQQIIGSIRFDRTRAPGLPEGDSVIDLNTGVITPLPEAILRSLGETAEGTQAESHYAASPDGSQLAYVATGDERIPQIFIAGIDGTGIRQVTHDPVGAGWPAWSPDGTTIAYVGGRRAPRDLIPGNLFILDVARGESKQIADGVVDPYSGIQFAPDGSSVVYTDPGSSSDAAEMRTVPVAGGQSTILFGGGHGGMGHAAQGSMSPDGLLVTMTGHEIGGPGAAVFVSNADGTQRRTIAGYGTNPAGTWSPDGSQIVCLSYGGRILVVEVATGDASPVAEGNGATWLDDHTLLVEA